MAETPQAACSWQTAVQGATVWGLSGRLCHTTMFRQSRAFQKGRRGVTVLGTS